MPETTENAPSNTPGCSADQAAAVATMAEAFGAHPWQVRALRLRTEDGGWRQVRYVVRRGPGPAGVFQGFVEGESEPLLEVTVEDREAETSIVLRAQGGRPAAWLGLDLVAREGEHFVGLGERFDSVDQRGRTVDLYVINGAVRDLTYKPVPFFMSSTGYGLHLHTDRRATVRLATPDDPNTVSVRAEGEELKLTLITGTDFKEILGRYTERVGRPAVPPEWVFGPWKSRDWTVETQATVLEDVRKGREHNLAGTVKLIDALWEPETHTFTFDREKYPDPEGMIAELQRLGYRLVLWISPFMVRGLEPSPAYLEAEANGYLIRNPDGETYVHRLGNSPTYLGSCIDFTNPRALEWWKDQIKRLVRMGVSGFKTDFGEQVPDDAAFFDGRTGSELHNAYTRLYNEATYEAMNEALEGLEAKSSESEQALTAEELRREGLPERSLGTLFARSAWDGSQRLSCIWAGDQTSDFGPASGLQSVITAGQTAGLSGFPYWSSDIGGYFGVPTDEVFIRWAQFGAFSPIMQIHGMGKREPWEFSRETLEIYRYYAQLHLDLFPYTYTYAYRAHSTGLPLMRSLALEFPNDPGAWGDVAEHEYMFGEELLVAPVYYGLNRYRHTYLPSLGGAAGEGAWLDFWTGRPAEAGHSYVVPAGLDTIPVFARPGSLVPMLDPSPGTLLPLPEDPTHGLRSAGSGLRLLIYPGASREFELFDGTVFRWNDQERILKVAGSPRARSLSLRMIGVAEQTATVTDSSGALAAVETGSLSGDPNYIRFALSAGSPTTIRWTSGPVRRGGGA
jgi:alpha-D-xyloside xylohydrolase